MKRATFAVLALLLAALPLAAHAAGGQTGNLSGSVVDAQTKAPIAGATVAAVSPSGAYRSRSDARGFFSLLGIVVDTYTLSIEAQGYESLLQSGVTIIGDQTLGLGTVALQKRLRTIGRVRARSQSSAFQPSQTVDSVTISGSRVAQTTGKAASTDEQALILAAPGTSVTNTGNITIRGGLSTEVGYQFDGVDYTEPFFATSATNGKFNGLGALQVVEGAGDATQGNVGGGVINIIPKRGARPPFGFVDAEAWAPNFGHQFAFEYGFASAGGNVSDYIAYNGQRDVPYYGYRTTDTASFGNFYGISYEANDDLVNNFIYKFGRNQNQSLQILYQNRNLQEWGNAGGLAGQQFYQFDPASYTQATEAPGQAAPFGFVYPNGRVFGPLGYAFGPASNFQRLIGIAPYTPVTDMAPSAPELEYFNPTRFLKFEYTRNLNTSTYLALRTYNWNALQGGFNNLYQGSALPNWQQSGGSRSGFSGELTKQFSEKHTVTLAGKFENQHPLWDDFDPYSLPEDLVYNSVGSLGGGTGIGEPTFLRLHGPAQRRVSAHRQGAERGRLLPREVLRRQHSAHSGRRHQLPRIGFPSIRKVAVRDQWSPSARLKFDLGLRLDGANYKLGPNPLYNNLSDPYECSTRPTSRAIRCARASPSRAPPSRTKWGRMTHCASAMGAPSFSPMHRPSERRRRSSTTSRSSTPAAR